MTVNSGETRISYSGDGSTKDFDYPYRFLEDGDLKVVLTDADGKETVQTLTTDYTVSGAESDSGGTVSMNTAPASGTSLSIVNDLAHTQGLDLVENDSLPAEAAERAFDRNTMGLKRLRDLLERSVRQSDGDTAGLDMTLPGTDARKNKTLMFDDNGEPRVSTFDGLSGDTAFVSNLTALRALDSGVAFHALTAGAASAGDGGGGYYYQDATDTTSAESIPDVIVASDGARWKLVRMRHTPTVATSITALKALDKTRFLDNDVVLVAGYATSGDGGGGQFYYDSSDTTSSDNGGTVIVATDGARWKRIYAGAVSVKWFGARGDDSTDDLSSIQSAIDSIASTGGVVSIPPGNYRISDKIDMAGAGVHLKGHGERNSRLKTTSATADMIEMLSGGDNRISDLSFGTTVTRSSGSCIRIRNGHNIKVDHIRMDAPYDGIVLEGGANQFLYYIENFEINDPENRGVVLGGNGQGLVQDTWLTEGVIFGAAAEGIFIQHASGIYASDIDVVNCDSGGVVTYPGSGNSVTAGFFSQVIADSCASDGWKIFTNGGDVATLTLSGCWGSSNSNHGFNIGQSSGDRVSGLSFNGCIAVNNTQNGIQLSASEKVFFNNCMSMTNAVPGGTKHGMEVAANVSDWQVIGGVFGDGGKFTTNNQAYGIQINSGSSDRFVISGVDLTGNNSGAISDGSSGGERYITDNIGFRTKRSGSDLIASGNNSVVVSHGLSAQPSAGDVTITPTTDPGAAGFSRYWISGVNATTFTVNSSSSTSGDWFFSWSARCKGA